MPQEEGHEFLDHEAYHSRWEDQFWGKDGGLQPGQAFDAQRSSPALTDLLQRGGLEAAGKRVLVPGCGRGYDLIEFVRAGAAAAVGLELAPSAQREAAAYLGSTLSAAELGKAEVHTGDFFKWQHPTHPAWDVAYDYTFFCALHPAMRRDWAAAYARYLAPGALLACLAFPIVPAGEHPTGPPWPVKPQDYKDVLLPLGFTLVKEYAVPAELSHPGRGGKEAMLLFRKD
ncbi:thiol methyltransferase 2 [Chlorella sorokiniana]|uniref:Thiol methyltransferase 2 n=1 Tax=Chlorella sorokiniana TaxID=3076 RepID=A0A2P6TPU2_CHLSO|nr:thiol methyltransferase 2 [Chlorella sorokiniana]|eukprot:PRW56054.1 thiol methyltransferase 2 [Chlorella sorokiniana]